MIRFKSFPVFLLLLPACQGAFYAHHKQISIVQVAAKPAEQTPLGITIGYDAGTVAIVPQYDIDNGKGEVGSLIARSLTTIVTLYNTTDPQNAGQVSPNPALRVSDVIISGAAAVAAASSQYDVVSTKTGEKLAAAYDEETVGARLAEMGIDASATQAKTIADTLNRADSDKIETLGASLQTNRLVSDRIEASKVAKGLVFSAARPDVAVAKGTTANRLALAMTPPLSGVYRFESNEQKAADTDLSAFGRRVSSLSTVSQRDQAVSRVVDSIGLGFSAYYAAFESANPGMDSLTVFMHATNAFASKLSTASDRAEFYRRLSIAIAQSDN